MRKDTIKRQLIRLADAMMKGGKKRQQCTGVLFEVAESDSEDKQGNWVTDYKLGGSCALGAVYEGLFGTPPLSDEGQVNGGESEMYARLTKKLPVLDLAIQDVNPDSFETSSIQDQIIGLNDDSARLDGKTTPRWKIARWIRSLAAKL